MQKNNRALTGAFLTSLGGICWGLSGSVGQYLFTAEHMDARWLVPIRLGAAGILLLLYCFLRYGSFVLKPWCSRRDRIDLLIYGLLGVSMCQFLYFLTIQLSSAAIATILQDLSPVLILLCECAALKRAPSRKDLLCVTLALAGVFLLSTHGSLTHLAIPPEALVTGILSAVCVTIYNVHPKRLLSVYPVVLLQGWAFLLGSILFALAFRSWTIPAVITPSGLAGILFVIIVGNLLAFPCYMSGVRLIGPKKSILYSFFEPLTAAVISVLFFQQPVHIADVFGFFLIFLMIILLSRTQEPSTQEN